YSLKQMEIFNVIEMLKSLELSLIEIKDFLASRSIAESVQLLNTKEHEIDLKIKQMEQLKESIKNKRNYLKESSEADFSTIKIV
ncbi:BltR family transcriptional regulator, partial [Enterobacter mori]